MRVWPAPGSAPTPLAWWLKTHFGACLNRAGSRPSGTVSSSPDWSHMVRAAVGFDFRHVAGGLEIAPPLVTVLRDAPAHPGFLTDLARITTHAPTPLPYWFFVWRWQRQEVDLKKSGIVPIANLARFHALANSITVSSTLDRLVAAEELGALDKETAQSLREAFAVIYQVRLDHHAQQIRDGLKPNNFIRPDQLPPLARNELREAFSAIAAPSSSSTDLLHSVIVRLSDQDFQLPQDPHTADLTRLCM